MKDKVPVTKISIKESQQTIIMDGVKNPKGKYI